MLLVSCFLKPVITCLVLSDSELAAMSLLSNNWSKILQDKTDGSRSPKTITVAMLHNHVMLFVAAMGLSLQDRYVPLGTVILNGKILDVVPRTFLYFSLNGVKILIKAFYYDAHRTDVL